MEYTKMHLPTNPETNSLLGGSGNNKGVKVMGQIAGYIGKYRYTIIVATIQKENPPGSIKEKRESDLLGQTLWWWREWA